MTSSLMDRRTAFMYLAEDRLGKETVRADHNTLIRYNWHDAPHYLDSVYQHARTHQDRVLIPFNSIITPRSLKLCTYFVIWVRDDDGSDRYIMASIYDAGTDYTPDLSSQHSDGFTAPKDFDIREATRWIKLFDVHEGKNFPFDDYIKETYKPDGVVTSELSDTIKRSKNNVIIALRKED